MNCSHCGRSTKMESEVDLPMDVDPRYRGHGQIRVDPNHPDNLAYDEALAPGRFEELAELRRLAAL